MLDSVRRAGGGAGPEAAAREQPKKGEANSQQLHERVLASPAFISAPFLPGLKVSRDENGHGEFVHRDEGLEHQTKRIRT